MPATGVYLVKLSSIAACAAALIGAGRPKVRLAGAEIDHVDALAPQPSTVAVTFIVGELANADDAVGEAHYGFRCGRVSFWSRRSRFFDLAGHRPWTRPPSEKTSLIKRELM